MSIFIEDTIIGNKEKIKRLYNEAKFLSRNLLFEKSQSEYNELKLFFKGAAPKFIYEHRDEFYLYSLYFAVDSGKKSSISYLDSLFENGLYHRIFLLAKSNTFRRYNDFNGELIENERVFNSYRDDSYIINSYFNILLANAQLEEASNLAIDNIDKFNEVELSRIFDTAIKFGLLDLAKVATEQSYLVNVLLSNEKLLIYQWIDKNNEKGNKNNEYPIYSISLRDDIRKREIIRKSYQRIDKDVIFIDGVIGRDIPRAIYKNLSPCGFNFELTAGVIGCSLSHIKAIETFYLSKEKYALIIEDDAVPMYNFNMNDAIKSIPDDFDILMVNERMSSFYLNKPEIMDGYTTVTKRLDLMDDRQEGWGGDGYIISRKGAELILENYSIDGVLGHFDGQLVSYGYECKSGEKNKANHIASKFYKLRKSKHTLNIFTLNFPFVSQVNFGYSSSQRISNNI